MIIMNLKLDGVYAFNNFSVNFSYPQKLTRTIIQNEFVQGLSNFRYKKVNVFLGSNACGKTTLIKTIWNILCFLTFGEKAYVERMMNADGENIEMDFVDEQVLYRMKIKQTTNDGNKNILIALASIPLKESDSYERCLKILDSSEYTYYDYLSVIKEYRFRASWTALLPATEKGFDDVKLIDEFADEKEKSDYLFILNSILKSLDSSIIEVAYSTDAKDAVVIEHENVGKIIVQDGNKLSSVPYLSSGTKYGISIANMLFFAKNDKNKIYLIDEQFSYINSDLEKAIVSTLVSMLKEGTQLFYTTHNEDILELGFPFHSFYFMKKKQIEDKKNIEISCASEIENRNNVSAKSIIDNDVFAITPDLNKIFDIEVNNE